MGGKEVRRGEGGRGLGCRGMREEREKVEGEVSVK